MSTMPQLITLLGPTAVGKTSLAARLAYEINGEVISADSRQVFRGMDIGTGKDLSDYTVKGVQMPFHLIDIAQAGTEYSVFNFIRDFRIAHSSIVERKRVPVLCGGTGLYLEAILQGYDLVEVPINYEFREGLQNTPDMELLEMLKKVKVLHNTTDSLDRQRLIRALEIETFKANAHLRPIPLVENSIVFGLRFSRETIRRRITQRLDYRLDHGMVEEVESLMNSGVESRMLKYYGLEYKYIAMHLLGEISYDDMVGLLNTAIHQFAKRQMTWFRRMEKRGVKIVWLEGEDGADKNMVKMLARIAKG